MAPFPNNSQFIFQNEFAAHGYIWPLSKRQCRQQRVHAGNRQQRCFGAWRNTAGGASVNRSVVEGIGTVKLPPLHQVHDWYSPRGAQPPTPISEQ